jgi:hypothetical protein
MQLGVSVLLLAASATAQQRPDFSGRWQLVPEANAAASSARSIPAMGSGWGADLSIAQDAATLTIEFTTYVRYDMQPATRLVYRLDGSESKNTINVGRGPQDQIATAAWDGGKLTLTIVRAFKTSSGEKPATVRSTQTLSLEAPATLVVETSHGAALGGKPSTSRSTYKKS